ncbi:ABC transporter ATP-binding protein [Flavisolibacter tropicus]|uniref:Xenobiotic-transporting ATPase n=1 Tax=Flavisolibacter tropicus TaxID=1492898 RepID=A0A172U1S7_9BACT|nr:ABC transporter ATP-binding protein [Flavisolibacter tropicus]ANE52957.1 xenobiotic-transporting ATPase [Flavisolibacter tropicus]
MRLSYKNNFAGYFKFYYNIVGNRLLVYLGLSIVISFLDGMGLSMFIPLLQAVNKSGNQPSNQESLGQLHHLTDWIQSLGFDLTITTVLSILVLTFLIKGVIKFVQLSYYASLKMIFLKKVRYKLLNNLENLSFSAFLKVDAGKIQNTMTNEVGRLFLTMTSYFSAAQSFAMLATYIFLAFISNYQFAILVCLGGVLSNGIYKTLYKRTKKLSIKISEKGSSFNSFLIQAVHYFKYLKSTNQFSSYSKKLKDVIAQTEILNKRIGLNKAIATSIKEPVIITIVSLVILLQVNWMGATLDSIILTLLLFYRALTALVAVQNDWQGFIENVGGIESITTVSAEMEGERETIGSVHPGQLKDQVLFDNVSFSYGSKKALDGVTISLPYKQTIALVGESGSGKTTIANMIAGLLLPDEGTVSFDGIPFKSLNLNQYRNKIGYISQESVIFNDSIYNNITFWAEPTSQNLHRFNKVLEMASLKGFIQSLPDKEKTQLGDNGILISGGQKQRISIARELYKECEILIFDEATSALDSETERVIQENIEKLQGSYTMVLIAHRLSTIKGADVIYLLENGKLSASGSFEEMMSSSTRFKRMVSLQSV